MLIYSYLLCMYIIKQHIYMPYLEVSCGFFVYPLSTDYGPDNGIDCPLGGYNFFHYSSPEAYLLCDSIIFWFVHGLRSQKN